MKKIIWILIVIVLVVGISYFATKELNKSQNIVTNTNTSEQNQNSITENKVNETSNIQTNSNNTENTEIVDEINEENEVVEKNTETFEDNPETEEEKAISIVKKDWGANDVNVKFSIEGINENGKYIVTVRDSNTTEAFAFYKVDVKAGSFEKKEMI